MKMNRMLKKVTAAVLASAMIAGLAACNNTPSTTSGATTSAGSAAGSTASGAETTASGEPVTINIFQFKVEINDALKAAIATYTEIHPNVTINLETVGGGSDYGAALRAKFQSSDVPTIFNIGGPQDLKDYTGKLEPLTKEAWVEKAVSGTLLAVTENNEVYGLPYAIEGYGLIYNKGIFEAAGIDASKLKTYADIKKAFEDLDAKIKAGDLKTDYPALEAVTEYPAKETWVTGLHTLNVGLSPEFPKGAVEAFDSKTVEFKYKDALKKLIDLNADFTSSGTDKAKLNAVDYSTQVEGGLAIERVAAIQQGNWIYGGVKGVDEAVAENLGILPLPLEGVVEDSIPVGVPMYWCVNAESDDNQKAAAKAFLDWLYQSEEGKAIVVNDFSFIPPFTNYEGLEPADSLGKAVKEYADAGKTIPWVFMGFPTDWGMGVFGTKLQDYFSGALTFDEVVDQSKTAWTEARSK